MRIQQFTLSLCLIASLSACSGDKEESKTQEGNPGADSAQSSTPKTNLTGDEESCSSSFIRDYNDVNLAKQHAHDALNDPELSERQKRDKVLELQRNCQDFQSTHGTSSCVTVVRRMPKILSGSDLKLACNRAAKFLASPSLPTPPAPRAPTPPVANDDDESNDEAGSAPAAPAPRATTRKKRDEIPTRTPRVETPAPRVEAPAPRKKAQPRVETPAPTPPAHEEESAPAPQASDSSKFNSLPLSSIRVKLIDVSKMKKMMSNSNLVLVNGKLGDVDDFKEQLEDDAPLCFMFAIDNSATRELDSGEEVKLFSKFERTAGSGGRELTLSIGEGLITIGCLRNSAKGFTLSELNKTLSGVIQLRVN